MNGATEDSGDQGGARNTGPEAPVLWWGIVITLAGVLVALYALARGFAWLVGSPTAILLFPLGALMAASVGLLARPKTARQVGAFAAVASAAGIVAMAAAATIIVLFPDGTLGALLAAASVAVIWWLAKPALERLGVPTRARPPARET
jgi:hypothetical protein